MTNSGSAITLSPPYSFRSQAGIASSDLLSNVQESFIELVSITTCDGVEEAVVPTPLVQVFNVTPTEPGEETPIVSLGSGAITNGVCAAFFAVDAVDIVNITALFISTDVVVTIRPELHDIPASSCKASSNFNFGCSQHKY